MREYVEQLRFIQPGRFKKSDCISYVAVAEWQKERVLLTLRM